MATFEKHHYVPQFYLKNFSIEDNRKSIALYNHKNEFFIPQASIKGQAYEKFLYGDDPAVEKELSRLENDIAKLFENPITKILPPLDVASFNLLKEYILVQLSRTKKAGQDINNLLNQIHKKIRPFLKGHDLKEELNFSHKFPSLLSLQHALKNLPLMNFLIIKSFVNLTEIPFITSDAPVILYNQFMESKGDYLGATGIAVMGLQIFLPIHPRLMYCLFDPNTYLIDNPEKAFLQIEDETNIHKLNALQYLFSESHLYFNEAISEDYIKNLVQEFKLYRTKSKPLVETFTGEKEGDKKKNYLFNSFIDPHINLELPFIKLTSQAKSINLNGDLPLRNPWFYKLREQRDNTWQS